MKEIFDEDLMTELIDRMKCGEYFEQIKQTKILHIFSLNTIILLEQIQENQSFDHYRYQSD